MWVLQDKSIFKYEQIFISGVFSQYISSKKKKETEYHEKCLKNSRSDSTLSTKSNTPNMSGLKKLSYNPDKKN